MIPSEIKKHHYNVIILILTIVGFILRIYRLSHDSLWFDEGFTIVVSSKYSFIEMIKKILKHDNHPPLYYIFMYLWLKIFPVTEFWVRLPSVIFGGLSIPVTYYLGKMISDENTGIISALFITISAFHIKYSQQARMYSMVALLSILATYHFVTYVKNGNKRDIKLYSLYIIIAMYSHAYGIFLFFSLNVLFFVKQNLNKLWVQYNGLITISYLPYAYFAIRRFLDIRNDFWIVKPGMSQFYIAIVAFFFSADILNFILVILFINFIDNYSKQTTKDDIDYRLIIIPIFIILIVPFLFSYYITPIFIDKYAIAASVFIFIGIAHTMSFKGRIRYLNFPAIFIIILLSSNSISYVYNSGSHDDFRGAMDYIDQNYEPNQILVFNNGGSIVRYLADYYLDNDLDKIDFWPRQNNSIITKSRAYELLEKVEGYWGIWLIYIRSSDPNYHIVDTLSKDKYVQVDYQKFNGIELFLFKIQL